MSQNPHLSTSRNNSSTDLSAFPPVSITAPDARAALTTAANTANPVVFGSIEPPANFDAIMLNALGRDQIQNALLPQNGGGANGNVALPMEAYAALLQRASTRTQLQGVDFYSGSTTGSSSAQLPANRSSSSNQGSKPKRLVKSEEASEVIEITSDEYEDDGAKYLPDDSTYRGRATAVRIKARGDSGPQTRSKAAKTEHGAVEGSSVSASSHVADNGGESCPGNGDETPEAGASTKSDKRKRKKTRRVKSAVMVVSSSSSDEEMPHGPPFTQRRNPSRLDPSPIPPTPHKRSRSAGHPGGHTSNEEAPPKKKADKRRDSDIDTRQLNESEWASFLGGLVKKHRQSGMSTKEIKRRINGFISSSKRWRSMFLDLEAIEDNDSSSDSSVDMDEYDSNDSFIDDSEMNPGPSSSKDKLSKGSNRRGSERRRNRKKLSAPEDATNVDDDAEGGCEDHELPTPGLEFEDFSRHHREMVNKQVEDDGHMAQAIERNQNMIAMRTPSSESKTRPANIDENADSDSSGDEFGIKRLQAQLQQVAPRYGVYTVRRRASAHVSLTVDPGWNGTTFIFPLDTAGIARVIVRDPVTDLLLQDPMLQGDYENLPKLIAGVFVPWSNIAGPGQARFSAWPEQCPDMDMALALRAIRFVSTGHFVNPSRASPTVITVREISSGAVSHSRRFHAYVESSPAIFVSAIFSELSKMREPTQHGLPQNMLQGKFHTQEWDRFVAFMCMVFGKRELNANVARDSMHFVTRALSPDGASGGTKSGMFSNTRSPSIKRVGKAKVLADNFALDTNNDVPIYDARDAKDFDFNRDLDGMSSKLPRWTEEVPRGSFAVVGYTAAVYLSNVGKWTLSCNIQWAMLLGTPAEEDGEEE